MSTANGKNNGSNYRWYILTLAALTFTVVFGMPTMAMPVLFKEISTDLDLSLVQLGTVWGIIPLAGMFVVLIGGLLSDRFGAKRVLIVACFLAGVAGALRGLSGSFVTLAITMFLFGFTTALMLTAVNKACVVWFQGRHLGLAYGVVAMGMALGFSGGAMISATILSPLLGGWRNVMFLYGATSIAMSVLWLLTRDEPTHVESMASDTSRLPFRQTLSKVLRIKRIWLLGLIQLGQIASVQGMVGYLPLYLRGLGWTAASADVATATLHWTSMIGVIPVVLLSDKLGSRKTVLFTATLMTAIGAGLLSVAGGTMIWVAIIIAGIARDGFMAVLKTTITETEGVGVAYAGTAIGLVHTISRLGGFAAPPIGNSLADISSGLPFIFWAALPAGALFTFFFIRETGRK